MDSKNANVYTGDMEWANDPAFISDEFNNAMNSDSPYGNTPFDTFTNMGDYIESPGGLQMRNPSKSGPDSAATAGAQQYGPSVKPAQSLENSSQDSSSDTSSMRKRKPTSESPVSDVGVNVVKKEDSMMGIGQNAIPYFGTGAMGPGMSDQDMFGFPNQSTNSSPINPTAFHQALSLNGQVRGVAMPHTTLPYTHESPVQTINPATFDFDGGSRDQSPAMLNPAMFNNSPNALFSTPSSDSNDTFNPNQNFAMAANPAWPSDFNAYTSPSQVRFTPSPVVTEATLAARARGSNGTQRGRSALHIAPISLKSRVETQINIYMFLESPPPGIEYLHLPLQTIAKSKLLAREDVDASKTLELSTMLVATSAMRNPDHKEKALRTAAAQSNLEIQRRAEQHKESGSEEDRNDLKSTPEEDKPASGGEVRICNNCIQRERKRAGRKKLKKEEEQIHWERYETERAVVFNSNEYLPWKAPEPIPQQATVVGDDYRPPEGTVEAVAAMRIACYCRHQSEKEGFQVIFTIKNQAGEVVAQEMSASILITDDHKTHPPSFSTQMEGTMLYNGGYPYGLPQSQSMVDMSAHGLPTGFPSSRSTGNLQGLGGYGQQYPQSHVHQLQHANAAFASQATSATMTPTSMTPTTLSRPGSPNSAGNSGPNKKRKSSSGHKKLPSGLVMTPRVDTSAHNNHMPGGVMASQSPFSPNGPTSAGFNPMGESYMSMPASGLPGQYSIGSGPPTPNDVMQQNNYFQTAQTPQSARGQGIEGYYHSVPSSRVGSRAASPVSSTRNLAAYQRAPPGPRNQIYGSQRPALHNSGSQLPLDTLEPVPTIHEILPPSGEVVGGTKIALYGQNFTPNTQVYFGDQPASSTFYYGEKALMCITPHGRPGAVQVIATSGQSPQYSTSGTRTIFEYKNPPAPHRENSLESSHNRRFEFASRYLAQQQGVRPEDFDRLATEWAQAFMTQHIGMGNQGYGG
ncbi:hypothetical protein B0A48_14179 [Cryoendolithus antarcticus]|uniref:Uncharacterized protein n=1 Tax=Cryoendolithus antarcticus TaxID=1507870 RepID=A0A1V8SLD5_9PEZI|nr:hypothetical protein B0A48_14179 [Cryoendolithus antarcticus]